MGIELGIVGVGAFAQSFIPLVRAHPQVDRVVLCDLDSDKLAENAAKHGLPDTCPSLDELCTTAVDGIVLMTQNWLHGPQAVQALEAGRAVYSAVPAGITVAEPGSGGGQPGGARESAPVACVGRRPRNAANTGFVSP